MLNVGVTVNRIYSKAEALDFYVVGFASSRALVSAGTPVRTSYAPVQLAPEKPVNWIDLFAMPPLPAEGIVCWLIHIYGDDAGAYRLQDELDAIERNIHFGMPIVKGVASGNVAAATAGLAECSRLLTHERDVKPRVAWTASLFAEQAPSWSGCTIRVEGDDVVAEFGIIATEGDPPIAAELSDEE